MAALGIGLLIACGGEDFDPQNMVQGVRILSTRADKPYAKPGETVTVDMLVADGRKDQTRPLKQLWFPFVCTNPTLDAYYGCFAPPKNGQGGEGAKAIASLPKGADLSTLLPNGNSYSFKVPDNAVVSRPGSDPYGTMFIFNVACAGRLVVSDIDPSKGPQGALPLSCTDEEGTPLSADNYVIGYTRVFAYSERTNANPAIDHLVFDGQAVDPAVGVSVAPCSSSDAKSCPEHKVDVAMKPGSQEVNANEKDANGNPLKEVIWAAYYTSAGRFDDDARLLFDAKEGEITARDNKYRAKSPATSGTMWVVVKDNRGGTDWLTIPLKVQ